MKKYKKFTMLVLIGTTVSVNAQNLMVIEMNNNSVYKIKEDSIREISFSSSVEDYNDRVVYFSCPDANHPHLIDLGLPSGTKWACCNIGANSPYEHGSYYAWGETEEKSSYEWDTYKHPEGYFGSRYEYYNIAETEYDVAHVKWGGLWEMPSDLAFKELCNNCKWNWISQNGIEGYLITGPNGGRIFLSASGYRSYGRLYYEGLNGDYWASNNGYYDGSPYRLHFYSDDWFLDPYYPYSGLPVRAVVTYIPPEPAVLEAVDLGLPSGTKWANWNIGATTPEDYGDYYAWGETESKDVYTQDTYKYFDNGYDLIGDDIAGTEYDVAHVKWGGSWRMPSLDQIKELLDNCTQKWTQQKGVNGILVTGSNGNTIFLPAAGYRVGNRLYYEGENVDYWSSSFCQQYYEMYAYGLSGDYSHWGWGGKSRTSGVAVRAVCP